MIVTSSVSPALRIGLRVLGVWPNVPHSTFYWLTYISSLLIIQYFQYLYIISHFKISELVNLADGLSLTLNYSLTLFKLTGLWVNRRILRQILIAMDNDWRECIQVDQHLYVMTIKASMSHFFSNAILSLTIVVCVIYFSSDYVIRFVYLTRSHSPLNDTPSLWQFPIKIQFPIENEQSSIFKLFVVTLFLHLISNASAAATLNGLMLTLVLHVSGQIDIMCQELRTVSEKISHGYPVSKFGMLIKRHNRVISFSNNLEKLFSFIVLMQVVWNTLVICCLGFIIIISVHNETGIIVLIKIVLAYATVMSETFLICFAGEYLRLKGKSIADAAYETLWYDMPSKQGKIITFIIMRSQKRLAITAGKMMDMSFEAFTNIMKASVSYVSVLYAMY